MEKVQRAGLQRWTIALEMHVEASLATSMPCVHLHWMFDFLTKGVALSSKDGLRFQGSLPYRSLEAPQARGLVQACVRPGPFLFASWQDRRCPARNQLSRFQGFPSDARSGSRTYGKRKRFRLMSRSSCIFLPRNTSSSTQRMCAPSRKCLSSCRSNQPNVMLSLRFRP